MIRDDRQVALNELYAACVEAGDHYREAASLSDLSGDRALFREIARDRLAMAADVERLIRATGDMPKLPDADRSAIEEAVTAVHAWISQDRTDRLRSESAEVDRRVVEAAGRALELAGTAENVPVLARVREEAGETVRRLLKKRQENSAAE